MMGFSTTQRPDFAVGWKPRPATFDLQLSHWCGRSLAPRKVGIAPT